MTSYPACKSLSACAWHMAACKHMWCKHCCRWNTRETERENHMFSTWNLTGWQQPWNLDQKLLLMWFSGLHAFALSCAAHPLSLLHKRALTGDTALWSHTIGFCAYMFLKQTSHLRAVGRFWASLESTALKGWLSGVLFCTWTLKPPSKPQLCCLLLAHGNCDLHLVYIR